MSAMFNRSAVVTVDATEIRDLRIAFKIEKTLVKHPNTIDLSVYNLSETTRKKIQSTGASVQVVAGYEEESGLIFKGQPTIINHGKSDADWITKIQSGDGVNATRQAKIVDSFSAGASMVAVAQRLAERTGLPLGNFSAQIARGNLKGSAQIFSKGFAVSGQALAELERLTSSMGYQLSIQDGALQLVALNETIGTEVIDLRPTTGLVGSPEVGEKGTIKARALLNHKLSPGRRVLLTSAALKGNFRIEKVTFTGDTHDQAWYADVEMKIARAA